MVKPHPPNPQITRIALGFDESKRSLRHNRYPNEGDAHERVYDVAVSGDRNIGADGRSRATVGNTVNIEEATFDNSIGQPVLDAYWKDPDFDARQRAFYYVRVLEIPTPRWTTYDGKHYKLGLPDDLPSSIQERAYTSPDWYTP